jgi:WD40 repeat protein
MWYAVDFHPRGQWLVSAGSTDPTLWSLAREYPRIFRGHQDAVQAVVFDPDGEWIASASYDQTVRIWPLRELAGQPRGILLESQHRLGAFYDLDQSPDGNVLIAGSRDYRAWLIPTAGGRKGSALPKEITAGQEMLRCVAFGPNGRRVALGGTWGDGSQSAVWIWDLETNAETTVDMQDGGVLQDLKFMPDGRLLVASNSGVHLWDLQAKTHETLWEGKTWSLALDPEARWIACSSKNSTRVASRFIVPSPGDDAVRVRVLDRSKGQWRTLVTHGEGPHSLAIDPMTNTLASAHRMNGEIRVGPISGDDPHLLLGHEGGVNGLEFSPDGQWLASAGDDQTVRLWPVPRGAPFHTLPYKEFLARLGTLTNLRAIRDPDSSAGYRIEIGGFPGWLDVPIW